MKRMLQNKYQTSKNCFLVTDNSLSVMNKLLWKLLEGINTIVYSMYLATFHILAICTCTCNYYLIWIYSDSSYSLRVLIILYFFKTLLWLCSVRFKFTYKKARRHVHSMCRVQLLSDNHLIINSFATDTTLHNMLNTLLCMYYTHQSTDIETGKLRVNISSRFSRNS